MTQPDNAIRCTSPPPGCAAYTLRHIPPSITLFTVHGELDAANAREFGEYAQLQLLHTQQLIVDLTTVDFFGTEAFSMLHRIGVSVAGKGARWVLLPGAAVRRLLRICDPDGALPTSAQLDDAVARVQGHGLLQLVPESS